MSIARWRTASSGAELCWMERYVVGGYVEYADHIKEMAEAQKKIDLLKKTLETTASAVIWESETERPSWQAELAEQIKEALGE